MPVEVHMEGALEPWVIDEEWQPTWQNMSAALNSNIRFFLSKDMEGAEVGLTISKIVGIRNLSSEEV